MFFNRKDRALRIFLSTSDGSHEEGEQLTSNARIPLEKWTHIAITRTDSLLNLYVNGILD